MKELSKTGILMKPTKNLVIIASTLWGLGTLLKKALCERLHFRDSPTPILFAYI